MAFAVSAAAREMVDCRRCLICVRFDRDDGCRAVVDDAEVFPLEPRGDTGGEIGGEAAGVGKSAMAAC